ncbi:MAG: hypothetical protein ACLRFK_02005 [Alphaproteobacteria bacterium]
MKNINLFTLLSIMCLTESANAANWWDRETVCKINTTKCYSTQPVGAGFDADIWDAAMGCRGMKYICPEAFKQKTDKPELVSIKDIESKTNTDYNLDILGESGDCFGKRKTDGTQIMVNGKYINLYCHGVLANADETLADGELTYGKQPTCETLKSDGFIAVANGNCIGKYIDESKYYIDCGKNLLPERLVLLNGAEITTANSNTVTNKNDANELFDKMYKASKKQKNKYFNK